MKPEDEEELEKHFKALDEIHERMLKAGLIVYFWKYIVEFSNARRKKVGD